MAPAASDAELSLPPPATSVTSDEKHHIRFIIFNFIKMISFFSFSTGFLTIMIYAGLLSIITFFIKKYSSTFVIAESHLDWEVSFIGIGFYLRN